LPPNAHRDIEEGNVASTRSYGGNGTPVDEQSLGELVATATRDMSLLIHKEIELAKTELAEQATKAGIGAGLLGGAGFLGFFALVLASFAGAFGFADGLNIAIWAGFLCMTGVYVLGAGILAVLGISRMKSLGPPERTKTQMAASIAWVKHPTRKA
jgi:Putative Actinobacterial Holin-X, holin superfamily III